MKKYDVKSLAKRGGDSTMLIVLMVILVIFFSVLNPSFLSANSFPGHADGADWNRAWHYQGRNLVRLPGFFQIYRKRICA